MLDILTLGEETLRERSVPVEKFDDALRMLIDAMFDTLDEADGVGLAGPQVGVNQRLFIVSIPEKKIEQEFINPEIVETSVETGPYEEGCLSIPGVYKNVERPLRVKVFAKDVNGKNFSVEADGLYARVIQHEYDHLNGKLFIDHLDEDAKKLAIDQYNKRKNKVKGRKNK